MIDRNGVIICSSEEKHRSGRDAQSKICSSRWLSWNGGGDHDDDDEEEEDGDDDDGGGGRGWERKRMINT